jgi:CheY-like chemotaxis protein
MRPHQVLVIDDDEDIRESLIDFLEDHGYQVFGAAHGHDALQKLGQPDLRPCVIILDLMMPVMDGKGFRQEQLRHPELSSIPVIIMSAYKDFAHAAMQLQVTDCLPKPLNLNTLLRVMREHCAPV